MTKQLINKASEACDTIDMIVSFMRGTAAAMINNLDDEKPFFDGNDLMTAVNLLHESSCTLFELVSVAAVNYRAKDAGPDPERPRRLKSVERKAE